MYNKKQNQKPCLIVHCLLVCLLIFLVCVIIDLCREGIYRLCRINKLFDAIAQRLPKGLGD